MGIDDMTLRTCVLTKDEQVNFHPGKFFDKLKAHGFRFESEACPFKLVEPWDRVDGGDGAVVYRQWVAKTNDKT